MNSLDLFNFALVHVFTTSFVPRNAMLVASALAAVLAAISGVSL